MRATAKPLQQVYKWRSLIAAIDRARTAGIYTTAHKRAQVCGGGGGGTPTL